MTKKKTSSVFISHSSKDNKFVLWLAGEFKKHGIKFWLDEIEIEPGSGIHKIIGPALKKVDRFLIVLSRHSIASHWVAKELDVILNRETKEKREIAIPLLLEEEVEIPPFIEDRKYSDFTSKNNYDRELKKLLKVLGVEISDGVGKSEAELYPNHFLPDLDFFVGRVELLKKIKETLSTSYRAVIHDISGLGKTFTSYKFVNDNLTNYEKMFFVRATKEEMLESLAKCGEMVNPALTEVTEQVAKALGFKQWLEENMGWLVVYDNVDEPSELFKYVPVSKTGDCIFTSNFRETTRLGTNVTITTLDEIEAGVLLYSRVENIPYSTPNFDDANEHEAFDHLVREIDGLPLTLNSTGAYIYEKGLTFARFWEKYQKAPEIAWESEDDYSAYQRHSAGFVFALAYEELCGTKKRGPFVKTVLDSMSFISPDEIPEDLLRDILEGRNESFPGSEEPDDLWDNIREKLTAYDLLKYDKYKKTFTTHRAIQRVIQSRLKGREKDICVSLAALLREMFPLYDYTNREECEKYYQHVLVLVENADRFRAETEDTNGLYFRLGHYQYLLGNYALAERFHLRAAEISAKVSGAESKLHATDLNDLALAYKVQGKYDEAIEKYEEVLRIDEKTIGREHPDYATSLNNLANVYREQGRHDDAIEKVEEARRITEKTVGREHPAYAIRLNNLALIYSDQGKYDEAVERLEEARRVTEKTVGRDHPAYAIRLNNLARVYYDQGKFGEALDLYKDALQILEKKVPENHPNIISLRKSVERCRKLVN